MSDATYSVVVGGQIQEGVEFDQVRDEFARLFKIAPEKAAGLLKSSRVLKKDLDEATAEKYRKKLNSIGLVVTVKKKEAPFTTSSGMTLALEPVEGQEESVEETVIPPPVEEAGTAGAIKPAEPVGTECPKCGHQQPSSVKQCEGCGFQLHQVSKKPAVGSAFAGAAPAGAAALAGADTSTYSAGRYEEMGDDPDDPALPMKAIGAGAATALIGALIWYGIGTITNYELAVVAWGIGGAVGFVIASTGGNGAKAGVVAALLTISAIIGAKCMVAVDFQNEFSRRFAASEEVRNLYEMDMTAVREYVDTVHNDESLRKFMVKYGHSASPDPRYVADFEIRDFNRDVKPVLLRYADDDYTYEDWYKENMDSQTVDQVSILPTVLKNLDILDYLFLFLGVASAWRLGQGGLRRAVL